MMTRIARYMTSQPWSVQVDDSVAIARRMLAEREIRHLPVVDGNQLVGIVTERDLAPLADHTGASVEDAMSHALAVDEDTPLARVLEQMLDARRDAVVVTSGERVAGIFTAMDAVRVLRELVASRTARMQRARAAH